MCVCVRACVRVCMRELGEQLPKLAAEEGEQILPPVGGSTEWWETSKSTHHPGRLQRFH